MEGSNERALKGVGYNFFFAADDIGSSDDDNDEEESDFDRRVAAVIAAAFAEDNDDDEDPTTTTTTTTNPVIPNLNFPPPACPSINNMRRRRSPPGGGSKGLRPAGGGAACAAADATAARAATKRISGNSNGNTRIDVGNDAGPVDEAPIGSALEDSRSSSINHDDLHKWGGDDIVISMDDQEFDGYIAAAIAAVASPAKEGPTKESQQECEGRSTSRGGGGCECGDCDPAPAAGSSTSSTSTRIGEDSQEDGDPRSGGAVVASGSTAAATAGGGDGGTTTTENQRLLATSFWRAALYLQEEEIRLGTGGGGGGMTTATSLSLTSDLGANSENDKRSSFANFVRELEKDACNLRAIGFHYVDWRGLREDDLEILFGRVLPALRTLEWISFEVTESGARRLPTKYLARLASAIPHQSSLTLFRWIGGRIDHDAANAIAGMIRRNPARLEHLELLPPQHVGLGKDELKTICDALPYNSHLFELHLRAHQVFKDSLSGAVSPSSPLYRLRVFSVKMYSLQAVDGIAEQLETNTTLTRLYLYKESNGPDVWQAIDERLLDDEYSFSPLRDVLETFNFTLQVLEAPVYLDFDDSEIDLPDGTWSSDEDVTSLLDRNERINRVLKALKVSSSQSADPSTTTDADAAATSPQPQPLTYHVKAVGMWPHYIEVTSDVPTPLYRLLRHGALQDVCHCLWARANSRGRNEKKKRGRAVSAKADSDINV